MNKHVIRHPHEQVNEQELFGSDGEIDLKTISMHIAKSNRRAACCAVAVASIFMLDWAPSESETRPHYLIEYND